MRLFDSDDSRRVVLAMHPTKINITDVRDYPQSETSAQRYESSRSSYG